MRTLLDILLLLLGFALLIKGANVFVDASVGIAKRLKIPSVIIGLTIVAMGTSLPEAVVSVSAAVGGSTSLAIGNVVGSNIFNLLFAVGICAVVKPVSVKFKEIARDYWISVAAAALLLALMFIFNDTIPRTVGFIFLAAFIVNLVILVRQTLSNRNGTVNNEEKVDNPKKLSRDIFFAVLGAALIVGGGQLTVDNAINIAAAFGISERVIGLTIVAVGTSLPELVTSLVALRKGENDIAVGNVIGSNVFNILFVLGLTGMVMPLTIYTYLMFDIAVLMIISMVFLLFAHTNKKIVRFEGAVLVMMYALYMVFIIL